VGGAVVGWGASAEHAKAPSLIDHAHAPRHLLGLTSRVGPLQAKDPHPPAPAVVSKYAGCLPVSLDRTGGELVGVQPLAQGKEQNTDGDEPNDGLGRCPPAQSARGADQSHNCLIADGAPNGKK